VQAFVNTFDKDAKTDELTSPRALANWFARWGLAFEDDLRLTNSDLEKAIAAREGLRSLIRANGGGNVDPRVVERLDRLASETAFRLRFEGAGATRGWLAPDNRPRFAGDNRPRLAGDNRPRLAGGRFHLEISLLRIDFIWRFHCSG
jgi:hypothetical protein